MSKKSDKIVTWVLLAIAIFIILAVMVFGVLCYTLNQIE